jgi:death-on-curing protein
MTVFGEEAYQTPFDKAAAMAESIVRNHPFNDANHRTALAAAHLVLGLASNKLVASQDAQIEAIRNVENGALSLEAFSTWLRENSILRSPEK